MELSIFAQIPPSKPPIKVLLNHEQGLTLIKPTDAFNLNKNNPAS
jgi:hypothetical protein